MTNRRPSLGSTYRLQLNGFGFARAAEVVEYLARLGVETLYLSPITKAESGSTHGYDVVDPTMLDPALGTPADFERLLACLEEAAMRALIDIVPNHMSTSTENDWWRDVLRLGDASAFATFFDIDWAAGAGKLVLPVLAEPVVEAIANGKLVIERTESDQPDEHVLRYGDLRLPLAPESSSGTVGEVLERQHYRLLPWRMGRFEINYRRFFDVDGLVGVRVEDPDVYSATHAFVLSLAADRRVAGLRVDHVDGLFDPTAYLHRLRSDLSRFTDGPPKALLIEKILARDEALHPDWEVEGTTGYEFADLAVALLTDTQGSEYIAEAQRDEISELETRARRQILEETFRGELDRLSAHFDQVLGAKQEGRDSGEIRSALRELTTSLNVYRTYLPDEPSADDVARIASAVDKARAALANDSPRVLDELVDALLSGDDPQRAKARASWQQLSSATAAKGVEDTALYRYCGLLSSADVGSDPDFPSVSVDEFHRAMAERSVHYPDALNATSTHDSKRSEDVRARLCVLSEIPDRWTELCAGWRAQISEGTRIPAYMQAALFQGILGTWPMAEYDADQMVERINQYMTKAAREAKVDTSWVDPDFDFEKGLLGVIDRLLKSSDDRFRQSMAGLVSDIGPAAVTNSLALTLLKISAPGVPDIYQGTELVRPLLVDPDNRRPVDFTLLDNALTGLPVPGDEEGIASAVAGWRDGSIKLFVTRSALSARRTQRDLFEAGDYIPLEVRGERAQNIVAFARRDNATTALVVIPRLPFQIGGHGLMPIGEVWGDTAVVSPPWLGLQIDDCFSLRSVATAPTIRVAELLSVLPIALAIGHRQD
jgi:(1->4)-alpha-D-glucan 1-alpha-D-glucosylmutase